MKHLIKIEAIGDDSFQTLSGMSKFMSQFIDRKPEKISPYYWLAELTGLSDTYKFERIFLKGNKDYSLANSKGSRGVFIYYTIEEEKFYEIKKPVTWRRTDRYFFTWYNNREYRLTEQQVIECLS
jgi:hypothetical protein